MSIFGFARNDVVGVATDLLSTNTQKATAVRLKEELDHKEVSASGARGEAAQLGPEVSLKDRVRLGATSPDYSQGQAPANASNFTSSVPLKA